MASSSTEHKDSRDVLEPLSIEAVSSIEDESRKRYGTIKIEDLTLFFVAFRYFLSLEGIAAQRRGRWMQPQRPRRERKKPQRPRRER